MWAPQKKQCGLSETGCGNLYKGYQTLQKKEKREREREREREELKCGGMEEKIGDIKIKNRVVVFLAEEEQLSGKNVQGRIEQSTRNGGKCRQ